MKRCATARLAAFGIAALHAAPAFAEVTPAVPCEALAARAEPAASAVTAPAAEAAWALALERFRGVCRPANHQEAAQAMKVAALAGHACAAGARGLMLARGWGVAQDAAAARERLQQSAERGCVRAPYWTWLMLPAALRPAQREPLTAGAALGDGHAANALGALHESDGQREQARQYYERAAAAGNTTAMQNLARLQRQQARSAERPDAAELARRADQGDAAAMYLLARRLHQGDGVATNLAEALRRYQRSAQLGHPAARDMLALIRARLGGHGRGQAGAIAALSRVELRSDELDKTRGLTQPLEDADPLAGL